MALFLKILAISYVWLYTKNVQSAPRVPRLSLAEPHSHYYFNNVGGYPVTYNFGYDVSDHETGNIQYRNEERYPNGTVFGSYGYVDPSGKTRTYQYEADRNGYRVRNGGPITAGKFQIVNNHKASTESSITWTRPKKKKKIQQDQPILLSPVANNQKYFELKPPSYYAIE